MPIAPRIRPGSDRVFPWVAAAVGILAGAGAYLSAVAACLLVLVLLEFHRMPLFRKLDPSKTLRHEVAGGFDRRFGTTAFPTAPDEPAPPDG